MAKEVNDVQIKPIFSGVVMEEIYSQYASPDDSLSFAENFHNDTIGTMTSRQPFVPVSGVSLSAPVTGYVVNNLVNQDKTLVYWKQGNRDLCQDTLITAGSQTTYSTFYGNATIRDRFDVIQNVLLLTNYSGTSAVYSHTGNTTTPAAVDTEFPNTVNIISAGFVGRVWGASDTLSSCVLFYSDVIPSAGILSLTTAAQQFLRINANNGDYITALVRTQEVLYVFTNNGVFRVFSTQSQDNASISPAGTPCQEAVVKTKNGIYFYHYSGVYSLTGGGAQEISRVIYPIIERVPPANQKNVFGWFDEDHVYWYLGALTGMTLNRYYIIRYTISTNVWTVYSTLTEVKYGYSCYLTEFGATETAQTKNWYPLSVLFSNTALATFNVDVPLGLQTTFVGDFIAVGGSEAANIPLSMETKWYDFSAENKIKFISGLSVASENASGFTVEAKLDKSTNPWVSVGKLGSDYVTLFRDWQSGYFNRIKFRISGLSYGQKINIGQISALLLQDQGYAKG